jgi:hypothetical protein
MRLCVSRLIIGVVLLLLFLQPSQRAFMQLEALPPVCEDLAFSTEEDFITQGPEPADGIPVISDGDLLGLQSNAVGAGTGIVCARNAALLKELDVQVDLGLDAADVVSAERALVAFSTELDSPHGDQFTAGDLLITNGAIIRNQALTARWQVAYDIGLDAVHLVGDQDQLVEFLAAAADVSPVDGSELSGLFERFAEVDIWFSTEGTWMQGEAIGFLDGDLLSARSGTVLIQQRDLPDPAAPAGIPQDGVDFGLDAVTTDRTGDRERVRFSTEILYEHEVSFTDGDVIRIGDGIAWTNDALIHAFEPVVRELGLDAIHGTLEPASHRVYLPAILKVYP